MAAGLHLATPARSSLAADGDPQQAAGVDEVIRTGEPHPDRAGEHGEDGYSGFSMQDTTTGEVAPTRLAGLLREAQVEHLVVVGLATDYCVRATALEGRAQGWPVTVRWSAVAAVDLAPGDGERTREELRAAGVTVE